MIKPVRRFIAATRAVAAVEFAIVAPVLLAMLVETFDIGNGIAVYMKVRAATFALAAMANTYSTGTYQIESTDMTTITNDAAMVLAPYSTTPAVFTITQIEMTSANKGTVSWSYSLNGTAFTQGTAWKTLPKQLKTTNSCNSYPCYLMYTEVSYSYTPALLSSLVNTLTLKDNIYVTPRSSACVQYLGVPASC